MVCKVCIWKLSWKEFRVLFECSLPNQNCCSRDKSIIFQYLSSFWRNHSNSSMLSQVKRLALRKKPPTIKFHLCIRLFNSMSNLWLQPIRSLQANRNVAMWSNLQFSVASKFSTRCVTKQSNDHYLTSFVEFWFVILSLLTF